MFPHHPRHFANGGSIVSIQTFFATIAGNVSIKYFAPSSPALSAIKLFRHHCQLCHHSIFLATGASFVSIKPFFAAMTSFVSIMLFSPASSALNSFATIARIVRIQLFFPIPSIVGITLLHHYRHHSQH